jgi:hypothetical protein
MPQPITPATLFDEQRCQINVLSAIDPRGAAMPDRQSHRRHHGTFSEGECDPMKHPEDEHGGTFAQREEAGGAES